MATGGREIQCFEDLIAWQKARELTRLVFRLTDQQPFCRRYRFCEQIQVAAVSIMNNIAEGFERNRRAEFSQFLSIAKGSCGEVRSMLYVALDAGFVDGETFAYLQSRTEEVARLIAGLRATVDRQRGEEHPRLTGQAHSSHHHRIGAPSPVTRSSKLEARSS